MRTKPMTPPEIGAAMRKHRESVGMTIWSLGQMSGVHPNTISNYELGRSSPTLVNIISLVDALSVSIPGLTIDEYVGRTTRDAER